MNDFCYCLYSFICKRHSDIVHHKLSQYLNPNLDQQSCSSRPYLPSCNRHKLIVAIVNMMFQLRGILSIVSRYQTTSAKLAKYALSREVLPMRRLHNLPSYHFSTKLTPEETAKLQEESKKQGQQFMKNHLEDVVELQSMEDWSEIVKNTSVPLLIDFYADWCVPCKKLTPRLEQRVKAASGNLRLLKINIDRFGQIANIFKIKSVPTVYLVYMGRAIDAFSGELSDADLDKFLETADRVTKFDKQEEEVMKHLAEGQAAIRAEDYEKAETILSNLKVSSVKQEYGFVRNIFLGFVYAQLNKISQLKATVEIMQKNSEFYTTKNEFKDLYDNLVARCEEVEKAKTENSELAQLLQKVQQNPTDLQLKFDVADYYKKSELVEEALEMLLEIVKANKDWEEKKANKTMLAIFKELGNASPITAKYRKLLQRALN